MGRQILFAKTFQTQLTAEPWLHYLTLAVTTSETGGEFCDCGYKKAGTKKKGNFSA